MSFNNQFRSSGFGMLPVVTKNIIIINVILFAFTFVLQTQGIDLNDYLGLHYYLAPNFKPHQFITYIFMHANVAHIFFNMFGVFMFGRAIEMAWGPKRFLIFYILTGLGAALAQYVIIHFSITPFVDSIAAVQSSLSTESFNSLFNSSGFQDKVTYNFISQYNIFVSQYNIALHDNPARALSLASQFLIDYKNSYLNAQVVIGASGSLFGLLGAYGMLFPNQMLYVYFLFPVKAKWLVTAYGAIELFSGLSNSPGDNVAHFAHLGGLFVGIILVLIWRRKSNQYY